MNAVDAKARRATAPDFFTICPTRRRFLDEYESMLIAEFKWASDPTQLRAYMLVVEETIADASVNTWHCSPGSTALQRAWRRLGLAHWWSPTLNRLRMLPNTEV